MNKKICQSCGMPITSIDNLEQIKMAQLMTIIVNIVTKKVNLLIK